MNTNEIPVRPAGKPEARPRCEEAHAVIGCAFEVFNELGPGLDEKLYENSLLVEFKRKGIACGLQRKSEAPGQDDPDGASAPYLIAANKVVVEARCIDQITDQERGRMMDCLRVTKLPVGLILNFKRARLDWERFNANERG